MKKLKIFLLSTVALLVFAFSDTSAQTTSYMKTSLTSSVDSITCVGTTSNYLYIFPSAVGYKCMSFQSGVRRVSTAIGGTLTLQGSNDGSNWFTTSAADTIHVTNGATDAAVLSIPASTGLPYKVYRMKCNGLVNDTMYVHVLFHGRK